jgi:hypothetical protein
VTGAWKPVAWLAAVGAAGSAAAVMIFGAAISPELWWGLAAPLASAAVSWLLMAGAAAQGPEKLTALMIKALAAKMLFFGVYVAVTLFVWRLRPAPFMASFTGFFIVFHAMEALFLKRLTK